MTDYLLVYGGGKMPEGAAEQAAVMKDWEGWFGKIGKSMKDGGNPFTGKAKTITSDGKVNDGAASASGYSIIQADSLDAAAEIAKGCPVLKGGAKISVYETFKVM